MEVSVVIFGEKIYLKIIKEITITTRYFLITDLITIILKIIHKYNGKKK